MGHFKQTVRQGAFTVVDMRDDAKIPDVLHCGIIPIFIEGARYAFSAANSLFSHKFQGMATELISLFEQAVSDSKDLSERPSNETLLQLYSLYKQSTDGDAGEDGPSNPFDFVAKAKFEAWSALKGKSKEAAMQEYIALVNKLKA
jgi:acyl-CoA-binding protein